LIPPVDGNELRALFVISCFLGALPPVDLLALCLVLAMIFPKQGIPQIMTRADYEEKETQATFLSKCKIIPDNQPPIAANRLPSKGDN
jgi:hypothetical protein